MKVLAHRDSASHKPFGVEVAVGLSVKAAAMAQQIALLFIVTSISFLATGIHGFTINSIE